MGRARVSVPHAQPPATAPAPRRQAGRCARPNAGSVRGCSTVVVERAAVGSLCAAGPPVSRRVLPCTARAARPGWGHPCNPGLPRGLGPRLPSPTWRDGAAAAGMTKEQRDRGP